MFHQYWVYMLASKPQGTLYIGVTNALAYRVEQHRAGTGSAFTRRYKVHTLVWYEEHGQIEAALKQEDRMKSWYRAWKINLLERDNPRWIDLYPSLPAVKPIPKDWHLRHHGSP